ncbi:hypothetical protein ACGFWD_38225 [Streptomyces sp. NPDC048448]|uniref:hypothetical protein n=1 Tax=Streptomyces sp. NPDC048448 TaxID=3365554 RepID=UPI003721D4CC
MLGTSSLVLVIEITRVDPYVSTAAEEAVFRPNLMPVGVTIPWADQTYAAQLIT